MAVRLSDDIVFGVSVPREGFALKRFTIAGVAAGAFAGVCVGYLTWTGGHSSSYDEGALSVGSIEEPSSAQGLLTQLDDSDPLRAGFEWLSPALERIDELGNTREAIEQVASDLPGIRSQGLRLIAIEILADRDLPGAIAYALTLDPPTVQAAALQRVASTAAGADAAAALDHASLIPEGPRRKEFSAYVLEAWVVRDPAAALSYIEGAEASTLSFTAETFSSFPPEELDRLLSVASRFPSDIRAEFERAVIDELIVSNPGSAYAYAEGLPAGDERDRLLTTIVRSHTQLDAREALTHILTMSRPPLFAIDRALAAIAADDFAYAFDQAIRSLVSGGDRTNNSSRLAALIAATSGRNRSEIVAALDLVASHPDQRVRRQLKPAEAQVGVVMGWAQVDPVAAAGWAIRNPSQVTPEVIEALGKMSASASGDSASAQAALYDLPEELRGYWMAGVAEGLATSSLDAALDWLAPARDTPVYATALDSVLRNAAPTEPEAVARAIDGLPDAPGSSLIINVAREWGGQEPGAAADWLAANGNIESELRAVALRQVVLGWAERDLQEARTWAMAQSAGALRDSALGAVVQTAAADGALDQRLLESFSTDSARAQALIAAMDALRRSDPDLGRSLIDRYISDPGQRDAAEQRLAGRVPPGPVRVVGGVTVQ